MISITASLAYVPAPSFKIPRMFLFSGANFSFVSRLYLAGSYSAMKARDALASFRADSRGSMRARELGLHF